MTTLPESDVLKEFLDIRIIQVRVIIIFLLLLILQAQLLRRVIRKLHLNNFKL
jgi:hypothetical protein